MHKFHPTAQARFFQQKIQGIENMLFYLIQTNFIDFVIVLYSYTFLLTNRSLDRKLTRMFLIANVMVNILIIADSLDYYFASLAHPVIFRYITSATGYTLRPTGIILIIFNMRRTENRHNLYIFLPLILNMIIAYTSVFTKWMFYFDENNQFHRGFLGVLPFLISGIYMLDLTIRAIWKFRLGNRKESAIVFWVALMSTVAVCMESFAHFKFIINGVGGISIVYYYLFLHTQTYKRDALTNALNRHSFYADINRMCANPMIIVSVDLNNLKVINDEQGHQAGDRAIRTVSNGIYSRLKAGCELYRMGGDEFTVLCPRLKENTVIEMMENAEKYIQSQGYEIAWGVAPYEPGTDFDKAFSLSDEKMYENKRKKKNGIIR